MKTLKVFGLVVNVRRDSDDPYHVFGCANRDGWLELVQMGNTEGYLRFRDAMKVARSEIKCLTNYWDCPCYVQIKRGDEIVWESESIEVRKFVFVETKFS